jgi:hypothetical protein
VALGSALAQALAAFSHAEDWEHLVVFGCLEIVAPLDLYLFLIVFFSLYTCNQLFKSKMRHIAAVLVVTFAVMNLGFILHSLRDLWESRPVMHAKPPELIKQRVCVLVSGAGNASDLLSSLAVSIEGDYAFSYGVFLSSYYPTRWKRFPADTIFHYVPVNSTSTISSLLFSAGVKGCSYFLTVDSNFRFSSPGWATAWVGKLRGLDPPYVGAVLPCADCVFFHVVHHRIFHRQQPSDACWVRWIRAVYGACRIVDFFSDRATPACPVMSTSGRLRVAKFLLALGPDYTAACPNAQQTSSLVVDV